MTGTRGNTAGGSVSSRSRSRYWTSPVLPCGAGGLLCRMVDGAGAVVCCKNNMVLLHYVNSSIPGYITFNTCCNCIPQDKVPQDKVTLMKAAATVESSVSAVILYPEEYSCNMHGMVLLSIHV